MAVKVMIQFKHRYCSILPLHFVPRPDAQNTEWNIDKERQEVAGFGTGKTFQKLN